MNDYIFHFINEFLKEYLRKKKRFMAFKSQCYALNFKKIYIYKNWEKTQTS